MAVIPIDTPANENTFNDEVDVWTKVNNLKSKKDGKAERHKDIETKKSERIRGAIKRKKLVFLDIVRTSETPPPINLDTQNFSVRGHP